MFLGASARSRKITLPTPQDYRQCSAVLSALLESFLVSLGMVFVRLVRGIEVVPEEIDHCPVLLLFSILDSVNVSLVKGVLCASAHFSHLLSVFVTFGRVLLRLPSLLRP